MRAPNPNKELIPHPAIWEVMEMIEKESGVKESSALISCCVLIIFVAVGMILGFLLIRWKQHILGGIVIILTPLLSFYLVVGSQIKKGS